MVVSLLKDSLRMQNKRRLFLAGATGMAGSSILNYLIENNSEIRITASYHNIPPVLNHHSIDYIQGDLRSLEDCRRMIKGCDCAIMSAAYAGGADFVKNFPWQHMKENLLMNIQMLEAFHLEGIRRVIFIGSAACYQEFEGSIKEDGLDLNIEPHDMYFGFGWAMRFIEKLCKFLNQKYGIQISIVRLANIFGPFDKFDPQRSNFIPALIRKAVDRMDPYEVWGSPEVTRDVLYSEDFAKAIAMMICNDKIKFDILNLGSGLRTTVGNVVKWALKSAGHTPAEIKYIQNKPTTIKFRALDCSKAKTVLGWEPKFSIEEGINKTTEWWMRNKGIWKR